MLLGTIAISGLAWLSKGGEDLLGKTYQADTLMGSGESFGSGNDKGKPLRLRTFGEDPRFQKVSFTTENGTTVLLTGLPSSSVDGIEAIGTQGTTEKYAALIRQLADQLEKSGEISSSEAAKIRLLADKGFIIEINKLSIVGTGAYRSPIVSNEQTPVLMDNTFIAKAVEHADWEIEKPSFLVDSHSTHICHVGQGEAKGQNCQ
jgi:hypothetical protein